MDFSCYTLFIIEILKKQLNNGKILLDFLKDWTTAMTVVFIAGMSLANFFIIQAESRVPERYRGFAERVNNLAQISTSEFEANLDAGAFYAGSPIDSDASAGGEETRFIIVDGDTLLNANNPLSNIVPTRDGLMIYKVQRGDTLSRIAANFGISLNTILWANENLKASSLSPGKEIVILPVTGVLHQVQDGDTLDAIANRYDVPVERILRSNPSLLPSKLSSISSIIIPNAKPMQSSQLASLTKLPNLAGFFSIPTTGWNWGRLHNNNAVDIANACGTPVYAAAEGLVSESSDYGWNSGYGSYVLIEHPNGTKTKYAHNQKNLVAVGDYVAKGDQIAIIGNTGLTHGPTGCHLHFEVFGARNPFTK